MSRTFSPDYLQFSLTLRTLCYLGHTDRCFRVGNCVKSEGISLKNLQSVQVLDIVPIVHVMVSPYDVLACPHMPSRS